MYVLRKRHLHTHRQWPLFRDYPGEPDFTEVRDSEWHWHQLGHMQVCTFTCSRQTTTPAQFFTGRMLFLPPNQQRQSTEGQKLRNIY